MSNPFYQGAVALIFTDENISAICYRISILCTGTGDTVTTTLMPTGEINTEILPRLIQYVQHWHWTKTLTEDWRHCKIIRFNLILYWMIYWIIYCHLIQVHSILWNSSSDDSIMDTGRPAAHSALPVPSHQEPPSEGWHWRQTRQSLQQQQQGIIWTTVQSRLS